MQTSYHRVILSYLASGGSRTRLLVHVHRECRLAGLSRDQTDEQLALWIRDVDEVDPAGAPAARSEWGRRGIIPLTWAFSCCDRRLARID